MSWDVVGFIPPPGIEDLSAIPKDYRPPAIASRAQFHKAAARIVPTLKASDPTWLDLTDCGQVLELSLGHADPIKSVMFHVRGGEGGIPVILELARTLGFRLLDCSSGEFLADDASNAGFGEWQEYRNRIVSAPTASQ
jgi:hypothetical protein